MGKAREGHNMAWAEGDDPTTPHEGYEQRRAIIELQARRISVGEAYRSFAILPDFTVLWQIGMRKTAIGMLAGWALLFVVAAALIVTAIPALLGLLLLIFIVMAIASWVVFFCLEEWTEDYNRAIDDQIRQLQGRKPR